MECGFPLIEIDDSCAWWHLPLIFAGLFSCCVLCFWGSFQRKRHEDKKRRKAVLDELYEDLWEEQPGTVNQYAARLHHLGMSEVQVLVQVREMRRNQSEKAGVSLRYLLSDEFALLASSRTGLENPPFHDMREAFWFREDPIGSDIICPRDGRPGCALVDWIPRADRREQTHYMSWIYKCMLQQVRSALEMFRVSVNCSDKPVFFFMSFFVNNQYRILMNDYVSDLAISFDTSLARIGQLVAIVDTWKNPINFKRAWCVYELFVAAKLDIPITIVTAKDDLDSLRVAMQHERGMQDVAKFLVGVNLQEIEAWRPEDEVKIRSVIQATLGFEGLNKKIQQACADFLATTFRTLDWQGLANAGAAVEMNEALAKLESVLWSEQHDMVQQNIRELCHLGMTEGEALQTVQQIRARQSMRAGVSLRYLLSMNFVRLACSRTGLANPTFHDMKEAFWLREDPIGNDIICPRDGRPGCALVDWIPRADRREQTHFMSWTWRYSTGQLRSALEMFRVNSRPVRDCNSVFFYMCFFVNNQYRIIVDGSAAGSDDLENSFQTNLTRIGKMVAVLDTWKDPVYLKRVWTVYEQFVACDLGLPVEFVMPSKSMSSLHDKIKKGESGLKEIRNSICRVDSERAEAWDPRDEARVMLGALSRFLFKRNMHNAFDVSIQKFIDSLFDNHWVCHCKSVGCSLHLFWPLSLYINAILCA